MSEYEKRAGEVFVILQKDLLWKKSVVKYNKDIKSAQPPKPQQKPPQSSHQAFKMRWWIIFYIARKRTKLKESVVNGQAPTNHHIYLFSGRIKSWPYLRLFGDLSSPKKIKSIK